MNGLSVFLELKYMLRIIQKRDAKAAVLHLTIKKLSKKHKKIKRYFNVLLTLELNNVENGNNEKLNINNPTKFLLIPKFKEDCACP